MTQSNDNTKLETGAFNHSDSEANSQGGDGGAAAALPDPNGTLYCKNHPNTDTLLRCNRCEEPICLKCAKLTDVGYRCNDCLRNVQDNYFNAESNDNLIAFGVAFIVTLISTPIAGFVMGFLGRFFILGLILAFMLGSGAGGVLAQLIRRAVDKRRGRNLRYFALAGIILGFGLWVVGAALFLGVIPGNLSLLIFIVMAASSAIGFLR